MYLNLSQLRSELGTRLKATTTISNAQKDLWLNLAQSEIALSLDPKNLEQTDKFTSTANSRKYFLNFNFCKIISIIDETNNRELYPTNEAELESADPDLSFTGTPSHWAFRGLEFLRAQPSASGVITIVSSSASDTTQKVRINGLISGSADTELLTLNGTTTVTGTKTWDAGTEAQPSIFSISKDGTTTGRITVARSDTLAVIAPNDYIEERQPIYLYPIPTATNTYRIRGYKRPRVMVNSEDFPDLPSAFHELVLLGAVIRGHRALFRFKAAAEIELREYRPMLDKFIREMGQTRAKFSPVIMSTEPSLSSPFSDVTMPIG